MSGAAASAPREHYLYVNMRDVGCNCGERARGIGRDKASRDQWFAEHMVQVSGGAECARSIYCDRHDGHPGECLRCCRLSEGCINPNLHRNAFGTSPATTDKGLGRPTRPIADTMCDMG